MQEGLIAILLLIVFLILGYEFYYKDKSTTVNSKQKETNTQYNQIVSSYISVVGMLTKIAKSDGKISIHEAAMITETIDSFLSSIAKQYKIPESDLSSFRQLLVLTHKKAKKDITPMSTYALYMSYQSLNEKLDTLQKLISIAIIDGYSDKKETLIYEAGRSLNLGDIQIKRLIDEQVPKQKQESHTNTSDPYAILGCSSSDSNETIKRQYRILIKKYHPDFIQSKGLDEAFMEFAKQKLQEINHAYGTIKKVRGI